LTDIADPDWQKTCLRIIECQSQVWGGAHSIIVPTDGKTITPIFWEILSAFDADIIFRYRKSGFDIAQTAPDIYEQWIAREVKESVKYGSDVVNADARARANFLKSPVEDSFFLSEELVRQLLIRLSPLHFGGLFHVNYISACDIPGYPLTSMVDLIDKSRRNQITFLTLRMTCLPPSRPHPFYGCWRNPG